MSGHEHAQLTSRIRAVIDSPNDRLDYLVKATGIDPSVDLRYGDWQNLDLTGADLRGFNFAGADLTGARFNDALIAGANFKDALYDASSLRAAADFNEFVGQGSPRRPIMRQYDLINRIRSYNPETDEALINRGYVYSMKMHSDAISASGDPHFSQLLEIAAILTDLKLDDDSIVAALLRDSINSGKASRAEIDQIFGSDIGQMVRSLTRLDKLDVVSRGPDQAKNVRALLLAIADDPRVLLVKLAGQLDSMRMLDHMSPKDRKRLSLETLDIFVPLADRMGLHKLREELEDVAFRQLYRNAYTGINDRLQNLIEQNKDLIAAVEHKLALKLVESGVAAKVVSWVKSAYSIWRKMEHESVGLEQLSDFMGFRIIVKTLGEVYRVLGLVHTSWPVVPGRFRDYVSTPKQNDYCSIHTTIVWQHGLRIELQIRTEEMHEVAEYGITSHGLYRSRGPALAEMLSRGSRAFAEFRRNMQRLADDPNPEGFLDYTRSELSYDQILCFTPKGKLIALPRKATPIDFAYAVHTEVGNQAVGCTVNGKIMPLGSELNSGDEVSILTSKTQLAPPAAFETIVVTGKARLGIRRAAAAGASREQ
jgi:GTP diphosphokinase / guanosine-3',5'-bis(diphosphate) 3'-diphosphatase